MLLQGLCIRVLLLQGLYLSVVLFQGLYLIVCVLLQDLHREVLLQV